MVDLADQVVLGNRVRIGLIQLAAVDHSNADMRFADIDIPYLLVEKLFGERFLQIVLKLGHRDIGPATHGAGRLGIGRVHLRLRWRKGSKPDDE